MAVSTITDEINPALEDQAETLRALLKSQQETIGLLLKSNAQKDDTIEYLQQQILNLQKIIFGSRSEKIAYVAPNQLELFRQRRRRGQGS